MKTTLLSLATVLLLATSAFAAPAPGHDDNRRKEIARRDDRNDRDFNYGYDRKHKVTAQERARWEAAHRNDRNDYRDNDRRDDRNDRDFNYGYDKKHKVTAQERARWEAAHRNDRYDGRR
ncbi:hypothetical protein J0X19_06270 [Hymenobacter sp. BT186]|uniref:Uncharacterized protein n=1 Tax=Hymenobacter telluris TaxID=2816474 RepID=A0A939EUU6_9BACT|nr:hypothetical protein [Hymenobacter telluris]MBO0357544.1 hypothetical protein [Hymenobacter telluris]MBW3373570.1 hypothetical protein [Hymenobacter norwichensis]